MKKIKEAYKSHVDSESAKASNRTVYSAERRVAIRAFVREIVLVLDAMEERGCAKDSKAAGVAIGRYIDELLDRTTAYKTCPYGPVHDDCQTCRGRGWVTRLEWNTIPVSDRGGP